jgi:hypothetical protein
MRTVVGPNMDKVYKYTFATSATWLQKSCKFFVKSLINKSKYKQYKAIIKFTPVNTGGGGKSLAITHDGASSGYKSILAYTTAAANNVSYITATTSIIYSAPAATSVTPELFNLMINANDGQMFSVQSESSVFDEISNIWFLFASGFTSATVATFSSIEFFGNTNYSDVTVEIWGLK